MIYPQTMLTVADNTGAKTAMCIRILGGNKKYAEIGDTIIVVVKEAIPNMPIKRSDVVRAIVVRTKKTIRRQDGMYIRFDDNAVVIVNMENNPRGTRVFGPVAREIRDKNFFKNCFISPGGFINVKKTKISIKVGDTVTIISGFHKNEIGEVITVNKKRGKIIVKGINFKFKHVKPNTEKEIGEIKQFEAPIHHSNVKVNLKKYLNMLNQHSLEEIAEINRLVSDIKKEYEEGIKPILIKNSPTLFKNSHTVPKLKKIQINRCLGLAAQNTNILKKSIEEFEKISGQKPVVTKSKKAIAGFKIRENMELGLTVTLRGKKMYTFLTKLIFFTFAQIRDFRGLSLRSFDKAGNYTLGLKEQLIFPEIDYDDIDQTQGFTINIILEDSSPRYRSKTIDKILNGMILFKFLRFPLNDCGYYEKYSSFSEINNVWERKKSLKRKRWSQE